MMRQTQARTLLLLFLLVLLILLSRTTILRGTLGIDSGIYAYNGWRLLHGEIPYLDVWDHKPPLIFFIDALGLLLAPDSMWGIWLLEVGALTAAAALGYWALARVFGTRSAALASLAWLLTLALVQGGGNRPESFALLPQFGLLALVASQTPPRTAVWRALLAGALGGIALLLKPTLVALWLGLVLYVLLTAVRNGGWRSSIRYLGLLVLGGLLAGLPVLLFFQQHDALAAMLDAVLRFNQIYAAAPAWEARLGAVAYGVALLSASGLMLLALAGSAGALAGLRQGQSMPPLLKLALLALLLELLFVFAAGRNPVHYYLSWLPAAAVPAASFFAVQWPAWRQRLAAGRSERLVERLLLVAMSAVPLVYIGGGLLRPQARDARLQTVQAAATLIEAQTNPTDEVLLLGHATRVNFLTRRRSPVRFTYWYPLFVPGYGREAFDEEFLQAVTTDPPILIIDEWGSIVEGDSFSSRQQIIWEGINYLPTPAMTAFIAFVDENYRLEGYTGPQAWPVYRYVGTADS